jgi:hypothetical protein
MLANMTHVSNVAPGPLVLFLFVCFLFRFQAHLDILNRPMHENDIVIVHKNKMSLLYLNVESRATARIFISSHIEMF